MISSPFRQFLFILIFLCPMGMLLSQNQLPLVLDSGLDVNIKLDDNLTLNAGIGYRDVLVSDLGNSPLSPDSRHLQISSNINYQLGFYDRVGGGLMYRFSSVGRDGVSDELRFTQEYIHVSRYAALRLAHRLKLDQRTFKSLDTEFRFRYRISLDFPLNGLKLDPGEFYALISTETLLNSGAAFKPEWDQRINLAIGNQLSPSLKGQMDIQYRAEAFSAKTQNRLFLIAALILGLN